MRNPLCSFHIFINTSVVAAIIITVASAAASSLPRQPVVPPSVIRIGARPSPLAQVQAKAVAQTLQQQHTTTTTSCVLVPIQAQGDHRCSNNNKAGTQSLPLAVKSVDFTGALDDALISGKIDVAVHSLKDVPPTARWQRGLQIAACLPREDPHDVLVGPCDSIPNLPPHAKVGTSSIRRQAQLLALRPDLHLVNLRGNVETRLGALQNGSVDALILARAGLNRLLDNNKLECHHTIPSRDMLSGCCQGIVAATCRANDDTTKSLLEEINDLDSRIAAAAERAFLDSLDTFSPTTFDHNGGRTAATWVGRPPLAALMEKQENCWIFQGLLARPDGCKVIRQTGSFLALKQAITVKQAANLGNEVAEQIKRRAGKDFYSSSSS